MDKTSPSSAVRLAPRSILSATFVVALSAAVVSAGGCSNEPAGIGNDKASGGNAIAAGGITQGPEAGGAGTATGGVGNTGSNGGVGTGSGGVSSGGVGLTSGGGTFVGSGGTATGTGGAPPCEDIKPPPDPEWPDATCENWATETEECGEAWFAEYCDVSCGRCVPTNTGGSSGTGGSPPCTDVTPPETPEWPGATCAEWATETEECGEAWFEGYCDASCGRCVPEGGGTGGSAGVDCSGEGLPNVSGGEGFATRYWDCCQPHCSQFNGHRCSQDGVSSTGDQTSACNGGGSFACYDEAPYAVTECLAYGHIAKTNPNCGGCYRIQFTGTGHHNANDPGSKLIKGKQMIVKVSNTGGDVAGNQFDLMIPGGGVGQFNACSRQWGTDDLGAQYGGFLTNCTGSHADKKECVRQNCMKIPAGSARDGCLWFVDWFEVADNPNFTSQPTDCPF